MAGLKPAPGLPAYSPRNLLAAAGALELVARVARWYFKKHADGLMAPGLDAARRRKYADKLRVEGTWLPSHRSASQQAT